MTTTTGHLGTPASRLGLIVLGSAPSGTPGYRGSVTAATRLGGTVTAVHRYSGTVRR